MRKRLFSKAAIGGYGTIILTILIFFAQGGFGQVTRYKLVYILGIISGSALFLSSVIRTEKQEDKEPPKSIVSPDEIEDRLKGLSPFQKKQIFNSYRGIDVEWTIEFHSIDKSISIFRHDVWAYSTDKSRILIHFSMNLGKYPLLKVLKKGEKFKVQGIIASVRETSINLKNCHLFFYDAEPVVDQEPANRVASIRNDILPVPTTSNISQITTQPTGEQKGIITPREIYQKLNESPPFQIDQVAKNYQGLEVEWLVALNHISSITGNLYTSSPNQIFQIIICPIDIEKYPKLKTMNKGDTFTIIGRIISVNLMEINLDNCQLRFQ